MTAGVRLDGLTKHFPAPGGGTVAAVNGVTLDLKAGEMLALLGPSGCGKTTVLRMVAGLERPDSGTVTIAGRDMSGVPPEKRNVGMVFQSYALFPHLSVSGNIAYGLRLRGLGAEEIRRRTDKVLELMHMDGLGERSPEQLSGGQQQRVALARALVTQPSVLLFDEPLSNLDANLREYMRDELRKIQRRSGIASLYVTHDHAEALAISDRIAVMRGGAVEQCGTGPEIYCRPANRFVAEFMGPAAFVPARALGRCGSAFYLVRPEAVRLDPLGTHCGRVERAVYLGQAMRYDVRIGEALIRVDDPRYEANGVLAEGDAARISFQEDMLRPMPE